MSEQVEYTYNLFISYAEADRAWVEGYLLPALGLPPERVITPDGFQVGAAVVDEFERAVTDSRYTVLVLSPAYLADEWSTFGEQLVSHASVTERRHRLIPLLRQPCILPLRIDFRVRLDCTDEAEWEGEITRLRDLLDQPEPKLERIPCPYPGMKPFSEADSDRFFGRDKEVQELLQRLRKHPFLAVIGPSGSGKSSLVFAGLVPALRQSGLFGPGGWLVRTVRPGDDPLSALATALESNLEGPTQAISELLAAHPHASRLLLVVDQFEELFTLAEDREVEPFQQALLRLAGTPDCYVVLTVRSDFYSQLMISPMWERIRSHRAEVVPLDEQGLRQAIVRPAECVDVHVEEKLVERLLKHAAGGEPGILPLLQEALVLLWERLERRLLPLRAYEDLGRDGQTGLQVAMAMACHADATLAGLTAEQQAMARRIFLRLIQFGQGRPDTRRQQPVAALRAAGDKPNLFEQTLHHLADHRLLTLSGEEGGVARRVDIAHEALIAGWPTLGGWVAERRDAEQTRRRLEAKAEEWRRLGRGGGLLDEVELPEAERWLDSPDAADLGYGETLSALVDDSRAAIKKAKGRVRRLVAAFGVVLVLAVAAVVAARISQQEFEGQRLASMAQNLAAQAVDSMASQQPIDLSLLLAVESWRAMQGSGLDRIVEADDALRRTLAEAPELMVRGGGSAVAFSPDGQTFATGSTDGARLWDASSGRELAVMQLGEAVTAVAYSPDAARLAIGSDEGYSFKDGIVRVWSLDKGADPVVLRHRLDPPVKQVVFSPNGRWLTARYEEPNLGRRKVRLWDTIAGSEWIPPEECSLMEDVTFSADGNRIAVAAFMGACLLDVDTAQVSTLLETDYPGSDVVQFSLDGNTLLIAGDRDASVWDVDSHTQRNSWHDVWAEAFALSPDGVRLAIAEEGVRLGPDGQPADNLLEDYRVVVRDTNTSRDMAVLHHSSPVDGVRFNADGSRLVTWSRDGTIRVWDAGLGSELAAFRHGFGLSALDFGDDGNRLASAGGFTVHVWEFAKGSEHLLLPLGMILNPIVDLGSFRHDTPVVGLAFSPEGRRLVTTGLDGTTRLWDAHGGQEPLRLRHEDEVKGFDLNSDGSQLASATSFGARVWDVAAGGEVAKFGAVTSVSDVAASPDGRLVANFCLLEPHVLLVDVGNGDTVATLEHGDGVNDVAFSPDSKRVATASSDGTACLWEADGGDRLHVLPHEAAVKQMAWSADGSQLVTFADGGVRVWDAASGEELEIVHGERRYDALAIGAEGVLLGATKLGNAAQVWDVTRNRLLAALSHHDLVSAVAFSLDGSVMATASLDGTARLWEARTGQPLAVLRHAASVHHLSFSADGMRLATGTGDTNVRVWRVRTQDLAARACQIAGRNLTLEEWKAYVGEAARYECTCQNLPPGEGAPPDACEKNADD